MVGGWVSGEFVGRAGKGSLDAAFAGDREGGGYRQRPRRGGSRGPLVDGLAQRGENLSLMNPTVSVMPSMTPILTPWTGCGNCDILFIIEIKSI
jgi:hypothetical protein